MIVNDTSFHRFSALTGYNKNQNLDIVVVLRAPLKYYKKKTYACILFNLVTNIHIFDINLHIAQEWQLIS